MKIALLSGRPENGTLLPRTERYVWSELCRILKEEMDRPVFKEATLLIPIYSKFDLQALYFGEKNGNKVKYFVPSEEWGKTALPKHQTHLINRMAGEKHINPSHTGRIIDMIEEADLIYILKETKGMEQFLPYMKGKVVAHFPSEKMRYTTERDARLWHEELAKSTTLNTTLKKLKSLQGASLDREIEAFLNGSGNQVELTKSDIESMLKSYVPPSEEDVNSWLEDYWNNQN